MSDSKLKYLQVLAKEYGDGAEGETLLWAHGEIERLRSEVEEGRRHPPRYAKRYIEGLEGQLSTALARVEALENQLRQKELVHVGYTNGHQVVYARDESGLFYPDTDHGCEIPLYMLKIHEHRLGVDVLDAALAREGAENSEKPLQINSCTAAREE